MAARTNQLFIGGVTVAASPQLVYTVPAGKVTILKSVAMFNDSANPIELKLRVTPVSGASARRIWASGTVAIQTGVLWLPYLVLESGDLLHGIATTNTANLLLSGSELTA